MRTFDRRAALLVSAALWGMNSPRTAPAQPPVGSPASAAAPGPAVFAPVKEVAAPGTPGSLAVWGDSAFVIAVGSADRDRRVPVIAAGQIGPGRVVAFSHSGLLSKAQAAELDTGKLIEITIGWAADQPGKPGLRVGLFNCDLARVLTDAGFTATPINKSDLTGDLRSRFDVLCLVGNQIGDKEIASLAEFIEHGGGVLAAQTAWAWKSPDGAGMSANPLNRLFARAGIAWTGGYAAKSGEHGLTTAGAGDPMLNAARALEAIVAAGTLASKPDNKLLRAESTALDAVRALPADDQFIRPRLAGLMREHAVELSPSEQSPITNRQPLQRLLLAAQVEETRRLPVREVRPHGASSQFPGPVPASAKRVTREVAVDPEVADWQSTGLYAGPGEVVTATIPSSAIARGIKLRIGCHSDQLWNLPTWRRVPEITRTVTLTGEITEAVSAFGGPVYLEGPRVAVPERVTVTLANVVEAPIYVLGQTTTADWISDIRTRPGPWAELVGKKIIVSVPSTAVRKLDDPESLMKFWDSMADAEDDLATVANLDRHHRQDRFVADVQISAGYMHSGYPIMTHLDAVDEMTEIAKLRKGPWGLVHELGHNHQNGDWTFDGTTEVTCNLFSMYVIEKACGMAWRDGHGGLKDRDAKVGPYLAAGAKFEQWKSDPFLALQMYAQLVEAFGWETFTRVFAEYRTLDKSARPANDQDKRDQWMVRFSRACGNNLGPFFDAWGVPVSAAAKDSVKGLPGWMPAGFPPK